MKILFVSFSGIVETPYLRSYLSLLCASDTAEVLYWDRRGTDSERKEGNVTYRPYTAGRPRGRLSRRLGYIPAVRTVLRALSRGAYDRAVFLQTHAAVCAGSILKKKYSGRYIVDVRDFTLENIALYRVLERGVMRRAYRTVISSEGFRAFLPEGRYTVVHNAPADLSYTPIRSALPDPRDPACYPLRVCFFGNMRPILHPQMKKIVSALGTDERFSLHFDGFGCEELSSDGVFASAKNVHLSGPFDPSETQSKYAACDLVNNCYGAHNRYLDHALSNKLYYAAKFSIPVLVSPGTYSAALAEEYGFGVPYDPDTVSASDLLARIGALDPDRMRAGCAAFLSRVAAEMETFSQTVRAFYSSDLSATK